MLADKDVLCDFCDAEAVNDPTTNCDELFKWNEGVQGVVYPIVPMSGYRRSQIKHACPKELCQARLLVWTRS